MADNCNLIKDLLPLYADEVCSDESRRIVAEHVAGCPACRSTLEKMNKQLVVNVNKDISTLRRIRKRIWIERIIIALVAVIVLGTAGWTVGFLMLNTDKTMDYEKHNLAENVFAEEDSEGNVWLVKQGHAVEAWSIYPNIRDKNGNYMDEEDFCKEDKTGFAVTLKERRISDLFMLQIESNASLAQERTLVIPSDSELTELYYYDDRTDTEYLLWKRGE